MLQGNDERAARLSRSFFLPPIRAPLSPRRASTTCILSSSSALSASSAVTLSSS